VSETPMRWYFSLLLLALIAAYLLQMHGLFF
jgi:hypothetical protein